jgi:DNA-binding CsgD family transcriptional regulator
MKSASLEAKDRQMLELLTQGASTRVISKKMGYSEGTVRVYLHNLYRKIGVRNRTEALLWQLEQRSSLEQRTMAARSAAVAADESFGDVALRDGLLCTLGIMESFIGPYGRLWEVARRLKNEPLDEETRVRRDEARTLWRSLLQGSFGYAKGLHDEGFGLRMLEASPSESVLLVTCLIIGGYSNAADSYIGQLSKVRRGARLVNEREALFMRSLRDAVYSNDEDALAQIHQLASEKAGNPVMKHVAGVALFHAYRARKDFGRARDTANALWAQAEAGRRQLEAMGVRPLDREAALPKPVKAPSRQAVREKVTAGS